MTLGERNTDDKLLVRNALIDDKWKDNPDIELNMISYLGFPIVLPDGRTFGTVCVHDNTENDYSETYEDLIRSFRDIIESHLKLIHATSVLDKKNRSLADCLEGGGIVPGTGLTEPQP